MREGVPAPRKGAWRLVFAASVGTVFLALRLPGLMALPIFCDESVYLRYAQLIARAPFSRAFLSVLDPKPPLHYWALALVSGATADPLLAARLLSVAAGLGTILLLFPLCDALADLAGGDFVRAQRSHRPSAAFLVSACSVFLASPFLAFYQRLALAESLLLFEAMLVAWLSLRWASDIGAANTVALGLALALLLLTKQNFSYALSALPMLAILLLRSKDRESPRPRRAPSLLAAFGLAVLLYLPYLTARPGPSLRDRLFYRTTHGAFGGGLALHARLTWENLLYLFVPITMTKVGPVRYEGFRAPADAGWLWIYLTPPIFLLALGGLAALAFQRQYRLLGFLSGWIALALLPFVPFATAAVSRYGLMAVPPLLLSAALALHGLNRRLRVWVPGRAGAVAAGTAVLAVLAWPLAAIALQDTRWQRQRFTRADRWQYVSGWPAGQASRQAVDALRAFARAGPIVVITTEALGTPNDVIWTYLDGEPNVSLFFAPWALEAPILRPAPSLPDRLLLQTGLHDRYYRSLAVAIPSGVPAFFVSMDPYPRLGGKPLDAQSLLPPRNPELREIARFSNPAMDLPHAPDSVVIYRLR